MGEGDPEVNKANWTAEQLAAIKLRGQILVAAAAGSGKTAVLVERLIQRITNLEEPEDVDRFLVVTFTKAAANEMRERVGKALEDALFQEHDAPEVDRLLRQRALLHRASITTLHSFCLELIRKYFYRLELDPSFRVADQAEADLLCQDALEELFEEKYAGGDQAFLRLVDAFGSDRDDQGLREYVLRLYAFAYSQPNPQVWLNNLAKAYAWSDMEALLDSPWGQAIRQGLEDQVEGSLSLLEQAERIAQRLGGPVPYRETLQDDVRRVGLLKDRIKEGAWAEIHDRFQSALNYARLPAIRAKAAKNTDLQREEGEETERKFRQEECRNLRDDAKKKLNALKSELFAYPPENQLQGLREMALPARTLGNLAWELAQAYGAAKKRRNVLDFNDLEHFALRLLEEKGKASLLAQGLQDYFVEVLVDEYQDINPVQERILRLVSRQGESPNLFMVGDVKQSIYRFRMSDPGLFLEKYHTLPHWTAQRADGPPPPSPPTEMALDLNRNFRSRREIVEGVNFLFRQILTESVGEIAYDDQAALQYGAFFVAGQGQIPTAEGPLEVHLLDGRRIKARYAAGQGHGEEVSGAVKEGGSAMTAENEDAVRAGLDEGAEGGDSEQKDALEGESLETEDLDKARIEARLVGQRIRSLVEGAEFRIYDKKLADLRPVRYADIVVLMRSYSSVASVYAEEFQDMEIPVYAETATGYFGAGEVETMLSLLKVIDNPHQDIPLAAVLRSPLVGLNGSELGKLRLMLPGGDFYEALAVAVLAATANAKAGDGDANNLAQILWLYEESLAVQLEQAKQILSAAPELEKKITDFWAKLQVWRTRSRHASLADLLWYLYEETGYLTYVGTLPAGSQRQANLRALYDRARRFEATRYRGLFRFLRFLERFREQGKDMGNARSLGETEDVVRLLTVHASKGLEFPVVFVVGLGRKFNTQSLRGKFLLHADLGVGMPIIDVENNVRYPSFIQYALRQRLKQESLAEELRILYVALTRPQERLFLYGNVDNLEKTIEKWQSASQYVEPALPDVLLQSAKCFLDWIGPALARHPGHLFGETEKDQPACALETGSRWEVQTRYSLTAGISEETLINLEDERDSGGKDSPEGEEEAVQCWFAEVQRRLSWQYPRLQAVRQVAKTSVSELKRQFNWQSNEEAAPLAALWQRPSSLKRPKFRQAARPLTAAERGTALHVAMQHIPFSQWAFSWSAMTQGEQYSFVVAYLSELEKREILSKEQKDSVQTFKIVQFLNTPLGERFFHAEQVLREIPFTLAMPLVNTDNSLVQGVIDVVLLLKDAQGEIRAEVVDYKTDSLPSANSREGKEEDKGYKEVKEDWESKAVKEVKEAKEDDLERLLRERYALQLSLYALAIERLMKVSVSRCTLYSFTLGREISLPRDAEESFVGLSQAVAEALAGRLFIEERRARE